MQNKLVNSLSKHLFWDVEVAEIDAEQHSSFIIKKVLLYGLYSDFQQILNYYGLDKIIDAATKIKEIDKKTASYLSVISGVSKSRFACYTTQQSRMKHWNF